MDKKNKLYAAYCSGLVDGDSRKACYPLVEAGLASSGVREFTEVEACQALEPLFGFLFEPDVMRQILQEGLRSRRLTITGRKYVIRSAKADTEILSRFDKNLDELINEYQKFCIDNKYNCRSSDDLRDWLIDSLCKIDAEVVAGCYSETLSKGGVVEYSLCKFIEYCSLYKEEVFNFITKLCLSNLRVESLAYSPVGVFNLSGLTVYIDTPIVYALVGLSDESSNGLYSRLVVSLKKLGCKIRILDRHWEEFLSGLHATQSWAFGPSYNAVSANVCARIIRQTWDTESECVAKVQERVKDLLTSGIAIVTTEYDRAEDRYQINETALTERICNLYMSQHNDADGRQKQITIDAVAISMIYRMRHGGLAYQIADARHLLITPNGTLAKACKLFDRAMRKVEKQKFVIPACIHSDLMASLIWVSDPEKFGSYQRDRMLAFCCQQSEPSQAVIGAFSRRIENSKAINEISDEGYVFLKCSAVVRQTLLRLTNGDVSAINEQIVSNVLESIAEKEREKFEEERMSFTAQLSRKDEKIKILEKDNKERCETQAAMEAKIETYQRNERRRCQRNAKAISVIVLLLVSVLVLVLCFYMGLSCFASSATAVMVFLFELWRMGSSISLIGRLQRRLANILSASQE